MFFLKLDSIDLVVSQDGGCFGSGSFSADHTQAISFTDPKTTIQASKEKLGYPNSKIPNVAKRFNERKKDSWRVNRQR